MKIYSFGVLQLLATSTVYALDYPFDLPESITAEIKINTQQQEKYNNKLLGTNIFKFSYANEKELIRTFDPLTIRFPHGLWANWYDWHSDSTRQFGEDKVTFTNSLGETKSRTLDHLSSIKIFEASGAKVGIDGLQLLNDERLSQQGIGYDMVWTFNMSADGENGTSPLNDGSPESVARYTDLVNRGFDVTNIEMGNENFYSGQRSSIIPNVSDYVERAKSISKALKAINPNIKLSIPLLRKANTANPNYNQLLTEDKDYFDAVTVHTYVGYDPDDSNDSDEAYKTALLARVHIANSVNNFSQKVAPNKPVWLTEWGVKSGGPNAASILGMADAYLFMSENQDIYQRANWFSVNGQLNSFLVWYQKEVQPGVFRPRIKEPLEKTLFGSAHEIIRSILQDSTLLGSDLSATELENGVKSVSARAVIKDDKVTVFALNLTDRTSPFALTLDNVAYDGNATHYTMGFSSLDEERILPIAQDPLSLVSEGSSGIVLPPLSLNKIVLEDTSISAEVFDVDISTQSSSYLFELGDQVKLQASVDINGGEVASVQFFKNGDLLATDTSAPYQFDWLPTTPRYT
ncbi:Ig-like domain-containing protein [Paraglaciecola aquimarina]|uniref:Ig-like domain-containing protein n=1 Tax=Paraglaciecola aquimarina TaxID=1235557 RepID=A0ABU3SRE2_9ALTE|nr:Ig-like domain-containing protein [Paraglaciecola aquimarina]MDU0352563.1 Ig-like domain-containing protein [Paraglaciecola aquimarina]